MPFDIMLADEFVSESLEAVEPPANWYSANNAAEEIALPPRIIRNKRKVGFILIDVGV